MAETCIEHTTVAGERWDLLAWHYYGDAMGYIRIIAANPHLAVTAMLPDGVTLMIPIIEDTDVSEEVPPWLV